MSLPEPLLPPQRAALHGPPSSEHERHERLLEDLIAAFDADARQDAARLWRELDGELAAHMDFEERHVLPVFRAVDRREAHALLQEHDLVRHRLIELGVGVDLYLLRVDVVAEFVALLRAHARREAALLYRWAEQELPAPQQAPFSAASVAGLAARTRACANGG
jgi:hypothetical protein